MKNKIWISLLATALLGGLLFTACSDDDDAYVIRVDSVSVDPELKQDAVLYIGQTLDIADSVTVLPEDATNKEVYYSSSDRAVATVSEAGTIIGVAAGTTTITVSSDGKSDSFTLKVEDIPYIAVESVTLPDELKDGVTLVIGQELEIAGKATIMPVDASNRAESYSSTDEDVATIDETGKITALAEGETTIRVSADGKSDTFILTVEDKPIDVTAIEFTISGMNYLQVGATVPLEQYVTVLPADASDKSVTFTSNNAGVVTVDADGIVTAVAAGSTTITVTAGDGSGTSEDIDVTVINANGDYADSDRINWEIVDHYPILYRPTDASETVTADYLFDDSNTNDKTFFALIRVGKSWTYNEPNVVNTGPDAHMQFVIDMKQPHTVNYFRFAYRSGLNQLRYKALNNILGSHDGENFEEIAGLTDVLNYDSSTNITDDSPVPATTYRYYKFYVNSDVDCFPNISSGASGQIRKIWLGYDDTL